MPALKYVEDCWQPDPRLLVRFPIDKRRLAVHPGGHTNPIQNLRVMCATAEAIDPFVLGNYGFGLSDLIEVGLSYSDRRLAAIRPSWDSRKMPFDDEDAPDETLRERIARIASTPVRLTKTEQDAAARFTRSNDSWIESCSDPLRARAAWTWATRDAATFTPDVHPQEALLGPVLALISKDGEFPVPVSLVIDGLLTATAQLAGEASSNPACRKRMRLVASREVLALLGKDPSSHSVSESPESGRTPATKPSKDMPDSMGAGVGVALSSGPRHLVLVTTASGLSAEGLTASISAAEEEFEHMEATVRAKGGVVSDAAVVIRLVLYAGPLELRPRSTPGIACIHVESLRDAWLEAADTRDGKRLGQDLLWQFVEELDFMPGVEELQAIEFDDVWRIWLADGVINPTGLDDVAIQPDPIPDDRHWRRAAAWEPFEELLFQTGLAPSWQSFYACLDDGRGQATVGTFEQPCLLLVDPPLIVVAPIEREIAMFGIDPLFAYGLADGVRLTAVNSPGVAAAIRKNFDQPLICALRLTTERTPTPPSEPSFEGAGISFLGVTAPRPIVSVLIGPDWLELLGNDPSHAHSLLGMAVAEGFEQAVGHPFEDQQAFLEAWDAAPSVGRLRASRERLVFRHSGSLDLPRSVATEGRARRALARRLVEREASTGLWTGAEAWEVGEREIIPALEDLLSHAVSKWDQDALFTVARYVNDAIAERSRATSELAIALDSPWAETWRAAAFAEPHPSELTRPVELLLEWLLMRMESGDLSPDRFDVAEAVDAVQEALRIRLTLHGFRTRLHSLTIAVGPGGLLAVAPIPADPVSGADASQEGVGFDAPTYMLAHRKEQLERDPGAENDERTPVKLTKERTTTPTEFVRLETLRIPVRLAKANRKLRECCGTGIDALAAVLATAVNWRDKDEVEVIDRTELVEQTASWASLPATEIEVAVDLLTLDAEQLRSEGLKYWEQERRRFRLATRPLLRNQDGTLILIPWRVHATQELYMSYMTDGRLPWASADVPKQVRDAFTDFRKLMNKDLERDAIDAVKGTGLPYAANVEQEDAAKVGLVLPGELDFLVSNPARRLVWVGDVKDSTISASPSTIADRIRKFLKPRSGYVDKLIARAEAINANLPSALALLDLEAAGGKWTVTPVIVTRHVEPAAFVRPQRVAFTTVSRLAELLCAA